MDSISKLLNAQPKSDINIKDQKGVQDINNMDIDEEEEYDD